MGDQKYTRADVAGRNGRSGAPVWIIIKDVVYDVTAYLQEHPGGEDILRDEAGKDATREFDSVGHSSDAKAILKKYRIGQLVEPKKPGPKSPAKASLVPPKKIPSPTGPPPSSQTKSPPTVPTSTQATGLGSLPAASAEQSAVTPIDPPVAPSASTISGTTTEPLIETSNRPLSAAPVISTPASNISTATIPTISSTLEVSSAGSVVPNAHTPTISSIIPAASTEPVKSTSSDSIIAPSAASSPVSNVSTAATKTASPILNESVSGSAVFNAQAGTLNNAPSLEATMPTPSAFNTPTTSVPMSVPTEGPKNIADTPNVTPVTEKTASKLTAGPTGTSKTIQKDASVKEIAVSSNLKTVESNSANGKKSSLVDKPGNLSTNITNGKSVAPSLSLKKSSHGLSMKPKSSAETNGPTVFHPNSKVSSSTEKPVSSQSQLPWNSSSKPNKTSSNPFMSTSSSSNSKSGTYDPFKKDKGSFSSFSGFKKK